MRLAILAALICRTAILSGQTPVQKPPDSAEVALRSTVAAAPRLPFEASPLAIAGGLELVMVSWMASAKDGITYLLQRGDKADPVIALDRNGAVLRSWGKGLYVMPHAIRVDPQGHVWTVD